MGIGTMSFTKWFGLLLLTVMGSTHTDADLTASQRAHSRPPQAAISATEAPSLKPQPAVAELSAAGRKADEPQVDSPRRVAATYRLTPRMEKEDMQKYKAVEVVATGYYAGKESTGKGPGHPEYGITYSGVKVKRDEAAFSTIAADPKVFLIGTVLYVPGYGYGVVADTGSAIKGKKIDLYFDTKDQVFREWGKRTVTVFIVKNGEGKMTEVLWNQLQNEILKI